MKPYFILSLDGGGIRGFITIQVLVKLEQYLHTIQPGFKICEHFDMFAGTSIGALLAILFCYKKMSAPDVEKVLCQNTCSEIMDKSFWDKHLNLIQSKPKYTGKGKIDVISRLLKDTKFSDSNCKAMIVPAYDIENRKGVIFNSEMCSKDLLAREVADATSASPAYFPCTHVKNCGPIGKVFNSWFIDGGIVANNPTIDAIAEAKDLLRKAGTPNRQIVVVNIGTGYMNRRICGDDAKDYGGPEWLIHDLIGIAMDESLVANRAEKLLDPGCYINVNHELTMASDDIDDCSDENFKALRKTSEKWWIDNKFKFENFFEL